jgi:hypothetical protein
MQAGLTVANDVSTLLVSMAPIERSGRIGLRVAPEEIAMLDALADAEALSASDVVRRLIRQAYAEKFGDKKPKPKK